MARSLRILACTAFFVSAVRTTAPLLLAATLAVAACSTAHVVTDYDRGTNFSSFRSFTVIGHSHLGIDNALVEQRTYDAIKAELTSRGFVYVIDPAQANFAVDFMIVASDRLDVRSYPAPVAGPWFGSWGGQVDVQQYQEGTLAIDVFDARSRKAVWHGSAEKKLSQSDIANSRTVVRDAVTAVLAEFPPKEN